MKEIRLTKGMVAIVDDHDFDLLNKLKWQAQKMKNNWYASTAIRENGKQKTVFMHRMIFSLSDKTIWVDHKDHNGLNNSRSNLRLCNRSQNTANRRPNQNKTSKFLGVCRYKEKWRAALKFNGKAYHLGDHLTEELAAKAYNEGAKKFHGEFANINII